MSRAISISIPHELGKAEAKRRIDEGLGRLTQQFGAGLVRVESGWVGEDRMNFTAHAMGAQITGELEVLESAVNMRVHLPNLLAALAGKLTGRLRKEGQLLLQKK